MTDPMAARPDAPELTAAPVPPERVETMARAMWNALPATPCGWDGAPEEDRAQWRRLAAAAIAAAPSPAEEAVKRVEALAEELDGELDSYSYPIRNGLEPSPADRIRAALASPLAGQHTTNEETDRG